MSYKVQAKVNPMYAVKMMHFNGKEWSEDKGPWKISKGSVSAPNLSIVNDQLCAAWSEKRGEKYVILVALRKKDGTWGKVFTAAEEDKALTNLIMPRTSPPNFLPIAWATQAKTFVKVLRIPVKRGARNAELGVKK